MVVDRLFCVSVYRNSGSLQYFSFGAHRGVVSIRSEAVQDYSHGLIGTLQRPLEVGERIVIHRDRQLMLQKTRVLKVRERKIRDKHTEVPLEM